MEAAKGVNRNIAVDKGPNPNMVEVMIPAGTCQNLNCCYQKSSAPVVQGSAVLLTCPGSPFTTQTPQHAPPKSAVAHEARQLLALSLVATKTDCDVNTLSSC